MKAIKKKLTVTLSLFILSIVFLSGCSKTSGSNSTEADTQSKGDTAQEESASAETGVSEDSEAVYPLTMSNYTIKDGTWEEKDQIFEAVPSRVVATTQPVGELFVRLGLTDKLAGVAGVYGTTPEDIAEEFSKIPVLSNDYVGKEITLGAEPDLIIGRGDLFSDADWGVGTTADLNNLNINTYVLNTCKQGATLEDLYKDINEIGQIFNVSVKAQEFSDSLRERVRKLTENLAGIEEPLTYAYANITDGAISIYAGSNDTFQNDALNLMKIDNAFKDATGEINQEQLIASNPDIFLVAYYNGGPDPNELIKQIYQIEAIQSVSAIQNKRIFVIDYNQFWGYSYQIFDGVENLAKDLYPDLIK